jgi:rhodanese-related sulfurtransferase
VTRTISAVEAKARLHGGGEIAFLDVSEAGQFGQGHPLFAVPCPYSRLELQIEGLVPNRHAPIVVIDAGDGVAAAAARRIEALGYTDAAVVQDGIGGWAAAGFTLFKGVNVPSKALGELCEAVWHPPMIDSETLDAWRVAGRPFQLFDARPPAEHARMRVPGARCLPNGELAHRFAAAVPDASMPVVVGCAGRTRGLIGAIGLRLAGIPNAVMALENGTQGWALAGGTLERGATAAPYPVLGEAELAVSRERALRLMRDWQVPRIDRSQLDAFGVERDCTLYLFDVRSAEEFHAGHLAGAVHAPGGQLVQATDQWIGVRRARVVLSDDTGLRAALAAFWLRQMGWDVYVLLDIGEGPTDRTVECEPTGVVEGLPFVSPQQAAAELASGTRLLLDLRPSQIHRALHPHGARWTIRPRLAQVLDGEKAITLLADDPETAVLAARDLAELGCPDVALMIGGMRGWQEAGLPVAASPDQPPPDEAIDFLTFVHDRHDGNLEASRLYLAWEQGLIAQLDRDERAEFRLARPVGR